MRQGAQLSAAMGGIANLAATKEGADLVKQVQEEIDASQAAWKGKGVPILRHENPVKADHKRAVNVEGIAHGCHTCGTHVATDAAQPWIGDHIPPTELAPRVIAELHKTAWFAPHIQSKKIERKLFPHCDVCAAEQSALVNALNGSATLPAAVAALDAKQKKLLGGGWSVLMDTVDSSSERVTRGESQAIQAIGAKTGCHSCGSKYPAHAYHADHCPPIAFHGVSVDMALKGLGVKVASYEARPQCPKCSHSQGGRMSRIDNLVRELMKGAGFKVYKGGGSQG